MLGLPLLAGVSSILRAAQSSLGETGRLVSFFPFSEGLPAAALSAPRPWRRTPRSRLRSLSGLLLQPSVNMAGQAGGGTLLSLGPRAVGRALRRPYPNVETWQVGRTGASRHDVGWYGE